MRLNTQRTYKNFVFIYIILLLMLAFDLVIENAPGGTVGQSSFRLGYVVVPIFLFLAYRGNPVFTYDSDGEVIILDSKEPSLSRVSSLFNKHYEFPKRKLVGYSFTTMPFRRTLKMKISSKDGKRKYLTASISYLGKQDVKDLERSLRGIISKNKKMGYIEENVAWRRNWTTR